MSLLAKNIDVYILCGGLGKRLRKVNSRLPKPLVEVAGRPFLDIILNYMAGFGFRRFILGVGYKGQKIRQYYNNARRGALNVIFSQEKNLLGTGGAIKKAKKLIRSDPFFILNGDSFCKFNPIDFLRFHKEKKSALSILLRKIDNAKDYGTIETDKLSRIVSFREKDASGKKCLINAGVYIFDRKLFRLMPKSKKFSLEYDFFPKLEGTSVFGYKKTEFFIDIGTPERYKKAKTYFSKHNFFKNKV